MLVAHSMGSHGGHHNFPFGYIPNELHGIGLPDFMTPGPPPGQPLLSEHDTQHLDSFLNAFDTGGEQNKDVSMHHFQTNVDTNHEWMMPPTLVGSETSLPPRNGADWQNFQMSDFTFGHDMNMGGMNQAQHFDTNLHGHNFTATGNYDQNLLHQLQNAAHTVQQPFSTGWQQNYPTQPTHQLQQHSRPTMRFGSDSHFQPSGYAPPEGQFEAQTTPNLDWLEAQSSNANTQPNTEPNTQPSSPVWPKKRKLDDYQSESRRNGFGSMTNGYSARTQPTPPGSTSQQSRTFANPDQPPTPRSRTHMHFKQEDRDALDDEDADFDEDDDPESRTRSASPASNPKNKTSKTVTKPARARKKSTASNTPNKSKSKPARNSTSDTPSARVPLTADQKKANHTNSEQRRRDATARAYAELYDLVPELEDLGKQSTMKKLEVVVQKVHKVKERVRQLRAALGFDVETGAAQQHGAIHSHMSPGTIRTMGTDISPDLNSWHT